jgi:hypothetical protein
LLSCAPPGATRRYPELGHHRLPSKSHTTTMISRSPTPLVGP